MCSLFSLLCGLDFVVMLLCCLRLKWCCGVCFGRMSVNLVCSCGNGVVVSLSGWLRSWLVCIGVC